MERCPERLISPNIEQAQIENSGLFSLQFHPLDVGDENTILVGSVFLDHVYSVFQYEAAPTAPYGYKGSRVYIYDKP